jgi:hypothetical protein
MLWVLCAIATMIGSLALYVSFAAMQKIKELDGDATKQFKKLLNRFEEANEFQRQENDGFYRQLEAAENCLTQVMNDLDDIEEVIRCTMGNSLYNSNSSSELKALMNRDNEN